MQKVRMVAPSPNVDFETVHKYKSTFRAPLSDSTQEALQLRFGGEFDLVAMNLIWSGWTRWPTSSFATSNTVAQ